MTLDRFFRPRSVALVGASERSPWSALIHGNFDKMGFAGDVFLVNKRGAPAHGQNAVTSCTQLPTIPDLAYVFVPTEAVEEAVADLIAAGVPNALILSSGYAETGGDGEAAQRALVARAHAGGLRILGPNSLGFINYAASIPVTPFPVMEGWTAGGIAIVSQSGATTQVIAGFAQQQGLGLSYAIATGNEADLDTAAVIDFLVDDADTQVIAIFAETIKNTADFRVAVRRAGAVGKPVIVLKVGRTALASQLAQAHTGSVTGDDRVFDAVCARDNLIRVASIEELVVTAGVLAHAGSIDRGMAIISISGGACEVIADVAEDVGLVLPAFSAETVTTLKGVIASYGATFNPLDVTGAAVTDPSMFETILGIIARDPAIGITACVYDMPRGEADYVNRGALARIGAGLAAAPRPGFLVNQALRPITAESRAMMHELGIPAVTGGLDLAVRAFAAAQRWSRRRSTAGEPWQQNAAAAAKVRPGSEREALDYLETQGVDTPPRVCARTAGEAIAAWRAMGSPVVLKIASPAILHKSDIGGVRLALDEEAVIETAFDEIISAARRAFPVAPIDGCLVLPMREAGIELFVGVARSAWGPVIAAGLGGVWIEALGDTSLRLLPITNDDAETMLGELRGCRLLDGYRGRPGVDRPAVARAIRRIGEAALALGPDLVSLEVNPLLAWGDRVEALDALTVWSDW